MGVGNNSDHKNKMVAPIIITVVMIFYYVLYFAFLISFVPGIFKLLLGVIPLVFAGVMIYVCYERLKEIEGGEEDDLGKY